MRNLKKHNRSLGWLSLLAWALLIIFGIVAKRVYNHPELMMLFHVPAAVFLVLAFYNLSAEFRAERRRNEPRLNEINAKFQN